MTALGAQYHNTSETRSDHPENRWAVGDPHRFLSLSAFAEQHLRAALTERVQDETLKADLIHLLTLQADAHLQLSQFVEAQDCASRVLRLCDATCSEHRAHAYNVLGRIAEATGDHLEALDCYLDELDIHQNTGDTARQAVLLQTLAQIELARRDLPSALSYAGQSLAFFRQLNHREGSTLVLDLLAEIAHRLGDNKAEFNYRSEAQQLQMVRTGEIPVVVIDEDTNPAPRDGALPTSAVVAASPFIQSLSHDLKTPLSSLLLNIEMLEKYGKLDDERGGRLLSRIRESADHLRNLVTDALDVARFDTLTRLHIQTYTVQALFEPQVAMFEEILDQRGLALQVDITPPDLTMACDMELFGHALENLISNAIKYSRAGTITLRAFREGDSVAIQVQDNGIGIDADDLNHIFERFFRAHNARTYIDGTGLGLYIVETIVKRHDGSIDVESALGEGTCFTMRLPAS